ncbi:MAG: hypothetical protein ABIW03_04020, partial [Sphingomicrobium sp.]
MNSFRDLRAATALCLATALALAGSAPAIARNSRALASAPDTGGIQAFYRARGGTPLWFGLSSGNAAQQLMQQLGTAGADNLDANRYHVRALAKVVQAASRGDPIAVQRAETMLSTEFTTYARDLRHDPRG